MYNVPVYQCRSTDRYTIDRHVRFNSGARWDSNLPCASKLDQTLPSVASRDFLGAWLVPKCAHFRGGSIWKVEIAALRGWLGHRSGACLLHERSSQGTIQTPHLARTVARARRTDSKICSDSSLPMLSGRVLTCADHPNSTASYPLYCAPCRTRHENALEPGLTSLPLTPARAASATWLAV